MRWAIKACYLFTVVKKIRKTQEQSNILSTNRSLTMPTREIVFEFMHLIIFLLNIHMH